MSTAAKICAPDALLTNQEGRFVIVNSWNPCKAIIHFTTVDPTNIFGTMVDIPKGNNYFCVCGLQNIFEIEIKFLNCSTVSWNKNNCIILPNDQTKDFYHNLDPSFLHNRMLESDLCELAAWISPNLIFHGLELKDDFGIPEEKASACKHPGRHSIFSERVAN